MEVKSVGTFPVILVKLVTPPLPPKTKLNFEQNFWGGLNIAGGGGGWTRVLRDNNLEGFFTHTHTLPSSFVLHCSFLLVSKVAKKPSG